MPASREAISVLEFTSVGRVTVKHKPNGRFSLELVAYGGDQREPKSDLDLDAAQLKEIGDELLAMSRKTTAP